MPVGRRSLVEPAQMRPPEASLLGAGNVVGSIGVRMMQAMVSDPARRMPRTVENSPENQHLFDESVQLDGAVREGAVVTNRGSNSAESHEQQGHTEDLQAGQRKQNQSDKGEKMDDYDKGEHSPFALGRFPEWPIPRTGQEKRDGTFFCSFRRISQFFAPLQMSLSAWAIWCRSRAPRPDPCSSNCRGRAAALL